VTVGDYGYLRRLAAERGQNSKLVAAEKDFQQAIGGFHYVEAHLREQLAERDGQIVSANKTLADLNQALADRDGRIARFAHTLAEREGQITDATRALVERDRTISAVLHSHSWKLTRPMRFIGESLRKSTVRLRFRLVREWFIIRTSGLFDANWYLERNPDVAPFRGGPLWHYLRFGATEGRDPHPLFCTSFYLKNNPDVAQAGINPLFHYLRRGGAERRDPHPLFSTSYYVEQNPEVAKADMNPLAHYLARGAYEGRDPHPHFSSNYYLKQNADVAEMLLNPLVHYVGPGVVEGRDPNPSFDTSAYLENNPEVALKGLNPLVHYLASPGRAVAPTAFALRPQHMDSTPFDLRAALRNELQLSGRAALDSDHDAHPLVSVVIPCFNHGRFLEDAVLSSLLACSEALEIVVVDDGSTDPESVRLADALADKYKFTLIRQANAGRASARNVGIQRAKGKFIQLLDADDLLTPGKIDTQLGEFRSDPTIDICICEYELCDANGLNRRMMNPSTIDDFSFSKEDLLLRWERGLSIPIHCALFRRELLEKTNFRLVTNSGHEDWILWIELSSRSPKFKFNSTVLATYRIHGRNTVDNHEAMGLDFLRACMYIAETGLHDDVESFLRESVNHFQTAYLGSIKNDAILGSTTHTEG